MFSKYSAREKKALAQVCLIQVCADLLHEPECEWMGIHTATLVLVFRDSLMLHLSCTHSNIVSGKKCCLLVVCCSRFTSSALRTHRKTTKLKKSSTLPFIFITLSIKIFSISFSFWLFRGKVVHLVPRTRLQWLFFGRSLVTS